MLHQRVLHLALLMAFMARAQDLTSLAHLDTTHDFASATPCCRPEGGDGPALLSGAADVVLRPGLVITKSVRVSRRVYDMKAPSSLDSAGVVIRGDNITVDFNGAELRGTEPGADPDQGAGDHAKVGLHLRPAA